MELRVVRRNIMNGSSGCLSENTPHPQCLRLFRSLCIFKLDALSSPLWDMADMPMRYMVGSVQPFTLPSGEQYLATVVRLRAVLTSGIAASSSAGRSPSARQ
jgi:hypothetical protein